MEKNIEALKKLKFFSDLNKTFAEEIIRAGEIREFKVKELIFDEYQELSELFILVEGTVTLGINIPKKGRISLDTVYPGQLFAWSSLFLPCISTAYAVANVPVRVFAIKASKIQNFIENNDTFGYQLMKIISKTLLRRLTDTRFQLVNLVTI
jgi:CRP-like cAMP-binding protein